MSMIDPAPALYQKYSEEWWENWRENHKVVSRLYYSRASRADKKAFRRSMVSAGFGLVNQVLTETSAFICGKSRRTTEAS